MNGRAPAILDHLSALADTTRSRLLLLLDRHELTVSELCGIMQLPQSTVSRHLKALVDSGWIAARAEGHEPPLHDDARRSRPGARRLWLLVREQVGPDRRRRPGSAPPADGARRAPHEVAGVLLVVGRTVGSAARRAVRRSRSTSRHSRRSPTRDGVVGDLGCGTGQVSAALAPFVARVIAVDASAAMLQAAQAAARGVRQRRPAPRRARGAADRRRPARRRDADARAAPRAGARTSALAEVARVLKPGGRVIVVRHAAARSRELSPADGPRVARVLRRAHPAHADATPASERSESSRSPPDARAKGQGCSSQQEKQSNHEHVDTSTRIRQRR